MSRNNRATTSTVDTTLFPDRRKETCPLISICMCHPQLIKSLKTGLGSCHPSVAACPLAQAIGDPAVHTKGAVSARAVTMPFPASVSCPCIRGSVLSRSASHSKPALPVLWPSACKAHVSHLQVLGVWWRLGSAVLSVTPHNQQSKLLHPAFDVPRCHPPACPIAFELMRQSHESIEHC